MPAKKRKTSIIQSEDRGPEAWLNAPQVMIWTTDENHLCTFCNQALMEYFGFTQAEIQGLNWLEAVHPDDRERIRQIHAHATKNYQNLRMEYRAKGKGQKKYIWILDISVPRFGPEGRFLGYIGSAVDITDQKEHEASLKNRQIGLEKEILQIGDREMSRIGRDLHDELSQHLLGVALKSMLLERKLKTRKTAETKIAQEITAEINQAIAKTRRVSQSLFPLSMSQKDLQTALNDLAQKIRKSFGVTLILKLQKEALAVDPDKGVHVYRIVQEAVTNSIRHGHAKKIQVSIKKNGVQHSLEIEDDGMGIAEDRRQSEGMGLHIMQYRAHFLEGELAIRRRQEGGTVVSCEYHPHNRLDDDSGSLSGTSR